MREEEREEERKYCKEEEERWKEGTDVGGNYCGEKEEGRVGKEVGVEEEVEMELRIRE